MSLLTVHTANDTPLAVHPAPEVARLRKAMEKAVEQLLTALDALDGDADLEPVLGAVETPSFMRGGRGHVGIDQRTWTEGGDVGEREPDPDAEWSLGSPMPSANVPQTAWAEGVGGDVEKDASDKEPSLGSLEGGPGLDQSRWATVGGTADLEGDWSDHEPDADLEREDGV